MTVKEVVVILVCAIVGYIAVTYLIKVLKDARDLSPKQEEDDD